MTSNPIAYISHKRRAVLLFRIIKLPYLPDIYFIAQHLPGGRAPLTKRILLKRSQAPRRRFTGTQSKEGDLETSTISGGGQVCLRSRSGLTPTTLRSLDKQSLSRELLLFRFPGNKAVCNIRSELKFRGDRTWVTFGFRHFEEAIKYFYVHIALHFP